VLQVQSLALVRVTASLLHALSGFGPALSVGEFHGNKYQACTNFLITLAIHFLRSSMILLAGDQRW
jgi:hypothetical protein